MLAQMLRSLFANGLIVALCHAAPVANCEEPVGSTAFTDLFNGKDLTGWKGGTTADPRKLAAMPAEQRAVQQAKWDETMRAHWRVENGELINDGKGDYATTERDFGDFELTLEYKTVPKADSGIYLRGVPQVQIWDFTEQEKAKLGSLKGSGGLWNNSPGSPGKDPLVLADKPFGEWNTFRIVMVGARVSVWLNGKMVVDHAILENYFDRKTPVPARGPIQLQTHGGEIRWRNIRIREIGADEANRILSAHAADEFESAWNGKDFAGWKGPVQNYEVADATIRCKANTGGTIFTEAEYGDFVARVEFKVPPGGNNGLAIRYPGQGDTAYVGMCEVQVLDDTAAQYAKLDPRQYCGSVYGVFAAHRGYTRAPGSWNFYEVTVKGSTIRVELNGTIITSGDVSTVAPASIMGNKPHPGMTNQSGHFGFAGHGDPVQFKNIRIKRL
jgi:hypothetical protein